MKKFLIQSSNPQRDASLWNMVASILNSFQSVVFMMVLTRLVGTAESGIFSIAFAYSNMFLTIGKYGMRHFQVSDRNEEFTFRQYRLSRVMTDVLMVVVAVVYILLMARSNEYTARKTWILLWMILFRLPDAWEDIYYGRYQQGNRLDVAAKTMAVRMALEFVYYLSVLVLTRDQLKAVVFASVLNIITTAVLLRYTSSTLLLGKKKGIPNSNGDDAGKNSAQRKEDWKAVGRLLLTCLPLFLGSFLTIYVTNAPKYAIDAVLSDELQAYYGYLSMPVSVIGLLGGFVFIPLIFEFTLLWNDGKIQEFVKKVLQMAGAVMGISIFCVAAAAFAGIPVLSALYGANLAGYRTELVILLIGGGFSALAALLNAMITVMRRQKWMLIGYFVTALFARAVSNLVVAQWGIRGASILFAILMALQCLCFLVIMALGVGCRCSKGDFST